MPVPRNTPVEKRRVKTGCVACRQRRRKCDEKKPHCTNCESRKKACKYASAPDPQSGTYAEITFVDSRRSPTKPLPDAEARSVPLGQPSNITRSIVSWRQPASQPTTHHHVAPSTWGSYFDVESAEASQREIALLRQFRYRIAPWLEAGDPDSQFGVAMMQMAQVHEPSSHA
ncbi:hypothetical protein LMH87_009343 [Akanthomyces muscarius]|uniref:Zn(2)-C6 fungal-type domain-containing protein n=1 Tax=Akanthomyces muscarius TaxID=2231603 RepID=A0A9W8QB64_AKAMU|nr:hypothetical protein LMH87_009343 [Akanthomyces muscarius]KAJ4152823.1 hypothetical protein LMH87_009343 [Akanthomyces muscarius]